MMRNFKVSGLRLPSPYLMSTFSFIIRAHPEVERACPLIKTIWSVKVLSAWYIAAL